MAAEALEVTLQRVFQLDKLIRYAAFVDASGTLVAGHMRDGVRSLDTEEQQQYRSMQRAIQGFMFKSCESNYGEYEFTVTTFSKLTLGQVPYGDLMLNFSTEKNAPITQIVNKIRKILNETRQGKQSVPP